jgi:hypothetical protein
MYQRGEYGLFVGRMMVGIRVEVEVCVSGFAVNHVAKGIIRCTVMSVSRKGRWPSLSVCIVN